MEEKKHGLCPKCGADLKEGDKFCISCGARIKPIEVGKRANSGNVKKFIFPLGIIATIGVIFFVVPIMAISYTELEPYTEDVPCTVMENQERIIYEESNFILEPYSIRGTKANLSEGTQIEFSVRADDTVNLYVLTQGNYDKWGRGASFSFDAELLDVSNGTLQYKIPSSGRYVIAIYGMHGKTPASGSVNIYHTSIKRSGQEEVTKSIPVTRYKTVQQDKKVTLWGYYSGSGFPQTVKPIDNKYEAEGEARAIIRIMDNIVSSLGEGKYTKYAVLGEDGIALVTGSIRSSQRVSETATFASSSVTKNFVIDFIGYRSKGDSTIIDGKINYSYSYSSYQSGSYPFSYSSSGDIHSYTGENLILMEPPYFSDTVSFNLNRKGVSGMYGKISGTSGIPWDIGGD